MNMAAHFVPTGLVNTVTATVTVSEPRIADVLAAGDVETALENVLENGIHPWSQSAFQMKAMMHMRRGRWQQAEICAQQLISMHPQEPGGYKIMGDACYLQCKYQDSQRNYTKALSLNQNSAEIAHDLGVSIISQGRLDDGIRYFRQAVEKAPNRADFHHHLAIMLVLAGHEKEGWEEMKWRLQVPNVVGTFPHPERYWNGEPLEGKILTVRSEQGWGDTIQFSRYLPLLASKAKKVHFWCQRAMVPFIEKFYPEVQAWPTDVPPNLDFDYQVAIMCLPRLFPGEYLPVKKQEYPDRKGVGICWFGSPTHKADHLRSVPVERFEGISKIAGGELICLGYGRFDKKPDFMKYYIDDCWDFAQTAERIKKLDLIITVDTAIAHLAGFMGVECWLMLPYVADFRWGMKGETTPWYESIKIYRQPKLMAWDEVFARVEKDLQSRYAATNRE